MTEELLRVFARFIILYGGHEEWCNTITSNASCSCSYGGIFDTANKFLKTTPKDDFLTLARHVEAIQNNMDRVLSILEKLVESTNE